MHHRVYHVPGQLWRKDAEIVGEYDEYKAQHKMPAVLPEIFIEGRKMLHVCTAKVNENASVPFPFK